MVSKLRAVVWSVAIGVIAVAAAGMLLRLTPGSGAVFVALLVLCVALFSALVALMAEVAPAVGAGAGIFAAALVALVLGLTIAVAPMEPGATRPGLGDLLWQPLLALLAGLALCGAAGWLGVRTGLRLSCRGRNAVGPPR